MGSRGQGVRPTQGPSGSRDRPTGAQCIKRLAYKVPGGQGVDLQGLRVSRGNPTGSQGVKG